MTTEKTNTQYMPQADILIVDDNPANLKVLGSFLVDQGYNVRIARNGQQAIESVETEMPELILLDIHMPVMDGYDACKKLKSNDKYSHIPIIFLSAIGDTFNKVQAFELGGADYIVKPFELEEVQMRVKVHLLANQLLAESKAGFRASFEQASVGIVHLNSEGDVLIHNHCFRELLGFQENQLENCNFERIFPNALIPCIKPALENLLINEIETSPCEVLVETKEGISRWLKVIFSPVEISVKQSPYLSMIIEDITGRKNNELEVMASRERIRQMANRLEEVREQERIGIARELHDELGHSLTGLKIDLTKFSEKQTLTNDEQALLKNMMENIENTVNAVRRISSELRPSVLDDLGLESALEWFVRDFCERSGIHYELFLNCDGLISRKAWDTAIFRIFQESLVNVARHSQAKKVEVDGSIIDGALQLRIKDDGIGMSQGQIDDPGSIGLLGMKERAALIGARISISSPESGGAEVRLIAPL